MNNLYENLKPDIYVLLLSRNHKNSPHAAHTINSDDFIRHIHHLVFTDDEQQQLSRYTNQATGRMTVSEVHPATYSLTSANLTAHFRLLPRLGINGAKPPPALWFPCMYRPFFFILEARGVPSDAENYTLYII